MVIANGSIEPRRQSQLLQVVKATQQSLDAHWPWLRECLLDIKASNEYPRLGERRMVDRRALAVSLGRSGRCRWTPEQVRWAVIRGLNGQNGVELFFVLGLEPDDVIKGFLISVTEVDPIAAVPLDFRLWLVWTGYPYVLEDVAPEIKRLAQARGCTAAEHSSPREGWWRRQQSCGDWQLKFMTWRWEF